MHPLNLHGRFETEQIKLANNDFYFSSLVRLQCLDFLPFDSLAGARGSVYSNLYIPAISQQYPAFSDGPAVVSLLLCFILPHFIFLAATNNGIYFSELASFVLLQDVSQDSQGRFLVVSLSRRLGSLFAFICIASLFRVETSYLA